MQLQEAVDGYFNSHIGALAVAPQAGAVPHIFQLFAQGAAHGQIDHGHTGDLGDIRHGTGRTRVDLDDVNLAVLHSVLHIDQAHNLQLAGKAAGVIHQGINDIPPECTPVRSICSMMPGTR